MKKLFLYLPVVLLFSSCIQEEALNAEADIVACTIMNEEGIPDENVKGDLFIGNNMIAVQAMPFIELAKLAPVFTLTPGATVVPASGTVRDFSTPQEYTVTSQDGQWSKVYKVIIDTFRLPVKYDFEHYEVSGKYQVFYEDVAKQGVSFKQYIWASGNAGYAMTGNYTPENYPTAVALGEGISGTNALKLTTKSTGAFGTMVKMPIAAGNLFIGNFDVTNATKDPLAATLFGLTFDRKPLTLKGYYKYKAGSTYKQFVNNDRTQKYVTMPNITDRGDIYAVLYESTPEMPRLNGANILSNSNTIAIARVQNITDVEDYVSFDVNFEYGKPGQLVFDKQKLTDYKYNLALVFTSSIEGAYFAGAEGSVLWVDKVEIIFEDIK